MTQVSRKTALEMQEGKAAEFTLVSALDFYQDEYQKHYRAMLQGLPYSQIVMDNALENIMRIAVDDETHQRYGDVAEEIEQEAAEIREWLQPVHSHTPVRVSASARWFRHGGTHPLSVDGAAYTWCTGCGEILSLDNQVAQAAWDAWLAK